MAPKVVAAHSVLPFPSDRRITLRRRGFADARAALEPYIARTPVMECWLKELPGHAPLYLKLENLQFAGGLQLRAVVNSVRLLSPSELARGLVTGAGGHGGEAVAHAASLFGTRACIYVPRPAANADFLSRLRQWNAEVIVRGHTREEAAEAAAARARRDGWHFVHPFADRHFLDGYGTLGLETLESLPNLKVLVMSSMVRGAALGAAALAVKQVRRDISVIGVETVEEPRLYESLRAGRLVETPPDAPPGSRRAFQITFDLVRRYVDDVVLVSRAEVDRALRVLWQRLEVAADAAGATAVAAILAGKVDLPPSDAGALCAVVGGRGEEGLF